MPPHRTLPDIFVSGRPSRSEHRVLTPRTPHSRAGRAEEGFTAVELDAFQDDESNAYRSQLQQQSQPLLSQGYRSRGDEHDVAEDATARSVKYWVKWALDKVPLIGGSILALILLILIAVSLKRPGSLEATLLRTPVELLETSVMHAISSPSETGAPTPLPPQSIMEHMPPRPFISYENYTRFPLTGNEYREECDKMMQYMHHIDYWDEPHNGPLDVEHHDDNTNYHLPEGELTKVCSSTITYMLDGHVGLSADLALMAQAAALARERNRTFLVDDTHWNRGKWSDHFQNVRSLEPGPEPGCRAPPPEELVSCPRVARHWVISSRTARYHMGHGFGMQYEEGHGRHLNRLKDIFEHAQVSFERTIRPNSQTAELIRGAREELASILSTPSLPDRAEADNGSIELGGRAYQSGGSSKNPALYIGVHIRRGDRIPAAYPYYPDNIIPIQSFVDGARLTWDRFYGNSTLPPTVVSGTDYDDIGDPVLSRDVSSGRDDHFPAPPIMWLASDSPPAAREFTSAFSSATAVFSLDRSTKAELRALAPVHEYVQSEFNLESLGARTRLTKGMIVDLAMVSGLWAYPGEIVPGAVVCGEGSNVCKVAALVFGFERAFGFDDDGDYQMGDPNPARARWVDVDNAGRIIPAWHAFEFH